MAESTDSTPVFVGTQPVGYVAGDTFYKRLRQSRHFLKRPPAIAFDIHTLIQAEDAGATKVFVTDIETGKTYRAPISDIWRLGKRFNRGYGWQIYLPLPKWNAPQAPPEQLALFQGARR